MPVYPEALIERKKIKPNIARWVTPGWSCDATRIDMVPAANRIYYIPIFVSEPTTYIRIGIDVQAGVAGTCDLRIFNWGNGVPGSLILSAGNVDTTAPGLKEITISQLLILGHYFLAARCTAAPTVRSLQSDLSATPPVSGCYATMPHYTFVVMYVDAAYADPAPAPTAVTYHGYAFVRLREN